jgi:hypothetical protein
MFSVFSSKPHPAFDVLLSLLSPLLAATKRTGTPLAKLIQDQFVAGFIAGTEGTVLKEHGLAGRQAGKVIVALNERFGLDLLKGVNHTSEQKPDYVEGTRTGNFITQYARGINDFDGHPFIERATESANIPYTAAHLAKTGEVVAVRQATREEISAMLVEHLFLEVAEQRLGAASHQR